MDVHEYPLKYNNLSLKPFGLATVVDSLVAIKKYVFDKQVVSFAQMRQAILSDWKGYEDLQNTILNDPEKYGNNCPLPDDVMVRLTKHLEARYCGKELARGGRLRLGLDSVYHCVSIAEKTAATPDGRHAGKPVSKNLCAVDGMDRAGITGYIQSLLKIDSSGYVDATVLDFILHPSAVEGEKGLRDFKSLIKVYLDNGGFAIQGNIVSRDTLIDAQQHPEKYATLQVRVCGWNEYFVKLNKTKQDMFIKQCEVSG
jgi:formate C-acetyltransferase